MAKSNSTENALKNPYINSSNAAKDESDNRGAKAVTRTLTDITAAIIGGFASQILGRASAPTGFAMAGLGQWFGVSSLTSFGAGMIVTSVSGLTNRSSGGGFWADAKERMKGYSEGLKYKFFLDKLGSKKEDSSLATETTNGMGEVKYLTYGLNDNASMEELDRFDREIQRSAENFSGGTLSGELAETQIIY